MQFVEPVPTRLLKAKVHAFAEDAARRLKFKYTDAIEPVVVRLGGRIEYKTAEIASEKLPESIIIKNVRDFTIYLPSITSAVRDRFTIAHELGHLFLHFNIATGGRSDFGMTATRWVSEGNEALERAEWEANWFAAAFLMPAVPFKELFEKNPRKLDVVAGEFGVSPKAAEVRAKSLGLM